MALKYGPRRSGSKRNSELIDIDPRQLIKQAAPEESRDALDDELAMHMENANRRYNNLLISPQRKIIEDILLETPEGESPPVSLIMQKINERYARVTDYYIQTAKNFEPTNASYELHRTLMNPVERFGLDLDGRVVVNDYDEINGGINPDNPESIRYNNIINGKEDLDGKPLHESFSDDHKSDTIIISDEQSEALDTSLFNF